MAPRITPAIDELQDTIAAAILAGLIVEPSFKPISGRFNDFGVSVDSVRLQRADIPQARLIPFPIESFGPRGSTRLRGARFGGRRKAGSP
ncbi:MAG: hypothetical protein IIA73_01000 [Proteobacteria bacterium]|nr:hypothetical protein [Pseudomonadota bacterium]